MSIFPFSFVTKVAQVINISLINLLIRQTRCAETNMAVDYTLKQPLISKTLANFQHPSLLTKFLFK